MYVSLLILAKINTHQNKQSKTILSFLRVYAHLNSFEATTN